MKPSREEGMTTSATCGTGGDWGQSTIGQGALGILQPRGAVGLYIM